MGKWRNPNDASLTGVDAQRAMLDELMGLNRNDDNPDAEITDFKDERICRHYLLGCCPFDVFSKTKNDLGPCELIHSDEMKEQFEEKKTEDQEWSYMIDLERTLKKYIDDVEKKIARGHRRLEGEKGSGGGGGGSDSASGGKAGGESKATIDIASNPEVLKVQAEIEDTMAQAEAKGEEGEVDEAEALMKKVEELKQKKAEIQSKMVAEAVASGQMDAGAAGGGTVIRLQDVNQKLRVCQVCGAFLSISDNDRRLADHFGGKLHLGYVQLRDKINEIEEKRQKKREARMGSEGAAGGERGGAGGEGGGSRREGGDRGGDRRRDDGGRRDRSRDRYSRSDHRDTKYGRPRSRSRDRDRDYRRGGDRRDRSRSRDRRRY